MSLTPEQREMRRTGIGSSEIAAVVGLSPYATPLDVWRAKVEGVELEETLPMKRGRLLEPSLAAWYAEDVGAELREPGTLRHPTVHCALATPDRIATVGDGAEYVVELKTAHLRTLDQWGEAGTDEVPSGYLCQVAWEMACADMPRADLAVLIAGDDFRVYHLLRDRELEEMLLNRAQRFWRDHVDTKRPPPIDGSESCGRWLAARHPAHRAPLQTATPEQDELARQLFAAGATLARAEVEERRLRHLIQEQLGDSEGVAGEGWKITWRTVKGRAKTDWAAVARDLGADENIVRVYTTIGAGYRRFCPTQKGEHNGNTDSD